MYVYWWISQHLATLMQQLIWHWPFQILRSIGYKSVVIDPEVPFDVRTGTIPNKDSRVVGKTGQ